MSRYIDADKLAEGIKLSIKSWGRDCNSNAPKMVTAYQDVLYRVEAAPTADVVEVRHSNIKWVNRPISAQCATVVDEYGKEHYGMIHGLIKNNPVGYCEECGKRLDDTFMNFCPNCGARMDGRRSENEG